MTNTDRDVPDWLRILAILLTALVVIVALGRARQWLHPDANELASAAPGCDLHAGPCLARFADGVGIELAIAPRPIATARSLTFSVTRTGPAGVGDTLPVALDFSSPDMEMGLNRFALEPEGTDRYRGSGMLPVCVVQRMTWYADVIVAGPQGRRVARFTFDTHR